MQVIVFSRDRALQLDALIRSYSRHVASPPPMTVIYRTDSRRHAKAYAQVIERHARHRFVRQRRTGAFRGHLLEALAASAQSEVMFLVDDIVFTNAVDFDDFNGFRLDEYVPSLRLGMNLSYCYAKDRNQPLPSFAEPAPGLLSWSWREGILDWGYPLSLDGHVFSRDEILDLLKRLSFKAPNSLEGALQHVVASFLGRRGVCYRTSRLVNVPLNRVQKEWDNRHKGVDTTYLLSQWERSFEIEIAQFDGLQPIGVHQELELPLVERRHHLV